MESTDGQAEEARPKRATITCRVCGVVFEVQRRAVQTALTCSPKCRVAKYRAHRKARTAVSSH